MRVPFLAVRTRSADETEALGEKVGKLVLPGEVLLLTGDLGTGKTTFVRGFARGLEVPGQPSSPSYVLVHEYEGGRYPLLHVDLFRCSGPHEVLELGLQEMLGPPRVAAIEWGEKAFPVVADDYLELEFAWHDDDDDARTISLSPFGRWRERMRELSDSVRDWGVGEG